MFCSCLALQHSTSYTILYKITSKTGMMYSKKAPSCLLHYQRTQIQSRQVSLYNASRRGKGKEECVEQPSLH